LSQPSVLSVQRNLKLLYIYFGTALAQQHFGVISVCNFIKFNVNHNFEFTYRNVISHFHECEKKSYIYFINLMFLLAKFHIHKCTFSKSNPLLLMFKLEMKMYFESIEFSKNLKAIRTVAVFKDLALDVD